MPERKYHTAEEAEAAYNAHVEACGGYPTLTQSDFYGDLSPEELSVGLDLAECLAQDALEDALFGDLSHLTDEAQDNNGW